MIEGFERVSEEQFIILKDAIAWITALIAGADGDIDKEETEWAEKLTKIRSYANPNELTPFYQEVGLDFHDRLHHVLDTLPMGKKEREDILTSKLSQVNDAIKPLDNDLAYELYSSYLSFAKHVAKHNGGFLGFLSIDKDEEHLMHLNMIDPIILDSEEEE